MPTIPTPKVLTNSSVAILNAIRNSASTNYRDYVPYATPDADSIKSIGSIIMDMPSLQNEFLNALINRIGRVMITSKLYEQPWKMFKKGIMEYGEVVEEVFVNMAKPYEFDPALAETTLFKREKPDVRSAFHVLNWQHYYPTTIQDTMLRQAFLTADGVYNLIGKIVESLYTGAAYDEFLTMKYMLAKHILAGHIKPVTISAVSAANAKSIVSTIKATSNKFEFPKTEFNMSGVSTYSKKPTQYLIVNADFDAIMDVEVLASAFHMDKAEFDGHHILVDGFGELDTARLAELFGEGETLPTSDELAALNAIPAVLVDENWFMVLDNLYEFTENYNGKGMYWNYFYHVWKTFSVSPFANAALFVPNTPAVSAVSITPESVTTTGGTDITFTAEVTAANFAPKSVNWSVDTTSATAGVTITKSGIVSIPSTITAGSTITVTAKSTYDATVYDTATITIPSEDTTP